jgi:hypothetical protein
MAGKQALQYTLFRPYVEGHSIRAQARRRHARQRDERADAARNDRFELMLWRAALHRGLRLVVRDVDSAGAAVGHCRAGANRSNGARGGARPFHVSARAPHRTPP